MCEAYVIPVLFGLFFCLLMLYSLRGSYYCNSLEAHGQSLVDSAYTVILRKGEDCQNCAVLSHSNEHRWESVIRRKQNSDKLLNS